MFLAFDVAEHAHDPLAFWSEISRLLRPGGVAILQTPVERRDYQNPFKERQDFFDDMEHLFLYTETSVERLTASAGLRLDSLQDAMGTLGQICVCSKSPSQAGRGREQ
jgi:SAM-dependent methyltransferase